MINLIPFVNLAFLSNIIKTIVKKVEAVTHLVDTVFFLASLLYGHRAMVKGHQFLTIEILGNLPTEVVGLNAHR